MKLSWSSRNNPRCFWKEVYLNIFTTCLESNLTNLKAQISDGLETNTKINVKRWTLALEKEWLEQELKDLDKQYGQIRLLLNQKGSAQNWMENFPTNNDMISDNSSSTCYRRRTETKNILEFIHVELKIVKSLRQWDYFKSNASS